MVGSPELRRGLLAVTVLHGVDLTLHTDGIRLRCLDAVLIRWPEWITALDGADPETPAGWDRLTRYARARILLAGSAVVPRLFAAPVGHPLHPGTAWVRQTVPGGVLDVGFGLAGLDPAFPDRVGPLASALTDRMGSDDDSYRRAAEYSERMAQLAAERLARRPRDPLRPMGQCDVVTLLAAQTFRSALVTGAGPVSGLRTAAVPMRDRGWLDLRRIDQAFVACAAAATEPDRRGFAAPLLVTADEVQLAGTRSWYSPPSASPVSLPPGRHRS